jgi:CDP-glycerol glycerophosphotransferase
MNEVHMPGTTTDKYKENFHAESSKWDYLISPNAYSSEIFARAFNVDASKILETGYPVMISTAGIIVIQSTH